VCGIAQGHLAAHMKLSGGFPCARCAAPVRIAFPGNGGWLASIEEVGSSI
jgi:hypothetical protein